MEEMKVLKDGNTWVFVLPDFKNLQVSPAYFADEINVNIDDIYKELIEEK